MFPKNIKSLLMMSILVIQVILIILLALMMHRKASAAYPGVGCWLTTYPGVEVCVDAYEGEPINATIETGSETNRIQSGERMGEVTWRREIENHRFSDRRRNHQPVSSRSSTVR